MKTNQEIIEFCKNQIKLCDEGGYMETAYREVIDFINGESANEIQ